jgi:hypothetical protein
LVDDETLLAHYDSAFANRVGLLLLERHRRSGWSAALEQRHALLCTRRHMTLSVIAGIARTLQAVAPGDFVVFKSIKPYPATPNDTDVLFLGSKDGYEAGYRHVIAAGYMFHEWAPQQRTVIDPRGIGHTGRGKKGGTYYIDLYEEISTDYFAYLNKTTLREHVRYEVIEDVRVPVLRPEPELAIVLFHNVFPERTFQLEHFFLVGCQLADPAFDRALFREFVERNHLQPAVRANLTLVAHLHRTAFGSTPEPLADLLETWGEDRREARRFAAIGGRTPHLFSRTLFWNSFGRKLVEWYSFRTALRQLWHLGDPRFFLDVVRSISRRLGEESVYKAE